MTSYGTDMGPTQCHSASIRISLESIDRSMNRIRPPIPPAVRRTVLRRAKGCCDDCGSRGLLELHHLTYMSTRLAPGPIVDGSIYFRV
jgi:hypothetical protein